VDGAGVWASGEDRGQDLDAIDEARSGSRDVGRAVDRPDLAIAPGHVIGRDGGTQVVIHPRSLVAELEVVVASIHAGFSQNEAEMTKRFLRAVENPNVHILGHLTGRLLLERESYKVNQQAVIDACAETGTWIELNCNPYRFDMDWRLWPYAISKGVKCVINPDAHRMDHVGFLRLGAGVARKGWLTKSDVINTLPLAELREALGRKRAKSR